MPTDLVSKYLEAYRQSDPKAKPRRKHAAAELRRLLDALGDAEMDFRSAAVMEKWRRFYGERTADMKPARKKNVRRIHRRFLEFLAGVQGWESLARTQYPFLYAGRDQQAAQSSGSADAVLLELRQMQMLLADQAEQLERTNDVIGRIEECIQRSADLSDSHAVRSKNIDPAELFPALDELQAALDWKPETGGTHKKRLSRLFKKSNAAEENGAEWKRGLLLMRDRMTALLEHAGVRPYGLVGETFDPNLHVAVAILKEAAAPANTISRVVRCGYRREERILRYADVEVFV